MVIDEKRNKRRKYYDGLFIDIKTHCPKCHTQIGEPGCTINERTDYSKKPKYKRPWKYDLKNNTVIYSGIFKRYYCKKCKKSFHDEFFGYMGKKRRPLITKTTLKVIDRIIDSFEAKLFDNVKKDIDKLIKQLKVNEQDMLENVVLSKISIGDNAYKLMNKAKDAEEKIISLEDGPSFKVFHPLHFSLNSLKNLIEIELPNKYLNVEKDSIRDNFFIPIFIMALVELYSYYQTEEHFLQKAAMLTVRYDQEDFTNSIGTYISKSPSSKLKFYFDREIILAGPCSERTPHIIAHYLEQNPEDKELKAQLLSALFIVGKYDQLKEEIRKVKTKNIYGLNFYKGFVNNNNTSINYFLKSIYKGELVSRSLLYMASTNIGLHNYKELLIQFKKIKKDFHNKIFPLINKKEWMYYDYGFKQQFSKSTLRELPGTYYLDSIKIINKSMFYASMNLLLRKQWDGRRHNNRKDLENNTKNLNQIIKEINIRPEFDTIYLTFIALYIQEKYDKALEGYRRRKLYEDLDQIEKKFDLNWHYFILGHCYLTKRQFKKAMKYFNAIVTFDSPLLEYAKIITCILKNDKKEAIKRIMKLMDGAIKNSQKILFRRLLFLASGQYHFEEKMKIPKKYNFDNIPYDEIIKREFFNYAPIDLIDPYLCVEIYLRLENLITGLKDDAGYSDKVIDYMYSQNRKKDYSNLKNEAIEIINQTKNERIAANIAVYGALYLASRRSKYLDAFDLLITVLKNYPKNSLIRRAWKEILVMGKKDKVDSIPEYKKFQQKYSKLIQL